MIIIYIDIILLSILLVLILLTCGYSVYRVHRLQQNGQVAILLRPTKVLFSHKKEGETNDQLRTVVAYQNPFTGDYCVHKSREPKGYVNSIEPDSPDSGVSDDQYEPLNLVPPCLPSRDTQGLPMQTPTQYRETFKPSSTSMTPVYDNTLNKTWKWNYTEYQI
ncbi:jg18014 [Pararge aegeria aegeria]|uniref:Jg18014 protein n=1 Tax=Pararge aegeria aegeria TaxID=348720 RepID=A0A8S4RPN6_9NEOP|nr:jg18014 [Pararge aegeria aegeria]